MCTNEKCGSHGRPSLYYSEQIFVNPDNTRCSLICWNGDSEEEWFSSYQVAYYYYNLYEERNKIATWCRCKQIRWKKTHNPIFARSVFNRQWILSCLNCNKTAYLQLFTGVIILSCNCLHKGG